MDGQGDLTPPQERKRFITDKHSNSLIVRIPTENPRDITPAISLLPLQERLLLRAELFRRLAEAKGMDFLQSCERAAKIARGRAKYDDELSVEEVLDYCLQEDIDTFTKALDVLQSDESKASLVQKIANNLFDGFVPSGCEKLPEDKKEFYADFACKLVHRKLSLEQSSSIRIRHNLPNSNPHPREKWNEQAKQTMEEESVIQQALRIKKINNESEFREELAQKAPILVPPGIFSQRSREIRKKGYVHYKGSFNNSDGVTYELRWHTKTRDENEEIPNFRVTKQNGVEEHELLEIHEGSPLQDQELKKELGIITDSDGKDWIPLKSNGDWKIEGLSRENRQLVFKAPIQYGAEEPKKHIEGDTLIQALREATHIDYVPKGMDCVTPSAKLVTPSDKLRR